MKRIIILSILTVCAFSQEITFQESLNLLINNNKELNAKKLSIEKSKLFLDEISANDYGVLNFKETYMKTNHAGYNFSSKLSSRIVTQNDFAIPQVNYPKAVENYETKLTYDLPLFTGFEISNAKEIARLQIKANEAKYNYDEKLMSLELLKAYNSCVASSEYLKAVQKAKIATNSFVEYANQMYGEGLVTKIDLDQAKLRDFDTNAKLKDAQNNVLLAKAYFNFLIGSENNDAKKFESVNLEIKDLKTIQNNALLFRDDLKEAQLGSLALKKDISIKKSDYYPKIGAHLEYGYSNNELKDFNNKKDFYLATVGLNIKLFDLSREAKIEKTRVNYNQMSLRKEYLKDAIKLEVKRNYLTYQTKKEVLKEKIKALNLASEILTKSEEMYKNNLIKMTDLLVQEAALQQARAEVIISKFDLNFSKAKLKLSTGLSLKE